MSDQLKDDLFYGAMLVVILAAAAYGLHRIGWL